MLKMFPSFFSFRFLLIALFVMGLSSLSAQVGKIDSLYCGNMGLGGQCNGGLVQPDSSIIVWGTFNNCNERQVSNIAKINQDGSNNYSFSSGTFSPGGTAGAISGVARQSNGQLIVIGGFNRYNGVSTGGIARFNTNGSIDNTLTGGFAGGGPVSIYIQSTGNIIVSGGFTYYNNVSAPGIVRMLPNGSRDTSFHGSTNAVVWALTPMANGQMLLGGQFTQYTGGTADTGIVRINSNGTIDTTFHNLRGPTPGKSVYCIALTPGGKILVGGNFTSWAGKPANFIARLNPDGSLDTTFSSGTGFNNIVYSMTTLANGEIVIGGAFTTYKGTTANNILRIDTSGSVDNTFSVGTGSNGTVTTVFQNYDGKIFANGSFTTVDSFARFNLVRLQNTGAVDQTFFNNSGLNGPSTAVVVQSSGKVVLAGYFTKYNGYSVGNILRLNLDGTLDTTFQAGTGTNSKIYALANTSNGQILVGGTYTQFNGHTANDLCRLNNDGSFDNTFTNNNINSNSSFALAIDKSNRIYAGYYTTYMGHASMCRFSANGVLDNTFNTQLAAGGISSIAVQNDGKVLIAGGISKDANIPLTAICRVDSNGNVDTATFLIGSGMGGAGCYSLNSVALQPDGKILLGGACMASFEGLTRKGVVRLKSNGIIDSAFVANTVTTGGASYIGTVIPYMGGEIIGGAFSNINNTAVPGGVELVDSNGNVNTLPFAYYNAYDGVSYIYNDTVNGRILVCGGLRTNVGQLCNSFAALKGGYIGNAIDSITITGQVCAGSTNKVYFKNEKNFNTGNVYTVQLSDSAGNFGSPTNIGTLNSGGRVGKDSISVTIPYTALKSSHYKVQISTTNAIYTSAPSTYFGIGTWADTISGALLFCQGGIDTLSSKTASSYTWSTGATTQSINVNTTATYTITVSSNGCSTTASFHPTLVTNPSAPTAPTAQSICSDTANAFTFSGIAVGSGGTMVEWALNSAFSSSTKGASPLSISVGVPHATSDSIFIRSRIDSLGCISSAVYTLARDNAYPLVKTIYAADTILKSGHSTNIVVVNSQPGIIYSLKYDTTVIATALGTGGNLNLITGAITTTDTFSISAKDTSSLCIKGFTQVVIVKVAQSVSVSFATTNTSSATNTGSVLSSAAGGWGSYHYHWSTGDSGASISNLAAGVYGLTVFDQLGDSAIGQATINYIVSWDTLVNVSQSSNGALITQQANYLYNSYALGLNSLGVGSGGFANFAVHPGDTFQGYIGFISDPNFNDSTQGLQIAITGTSLYVIGNGIGGSNYIGSYNYGQGYHFNFTFSSDSVTVIKSDTNGNNSTSSVFPYTATKTLYPFVAGTQVGSKITQVTANLTTGAVTVSLSMVPASNINSTAIVYSQTKGGVAPYKYSWSSGDTTANLLQAAMGNYILTVTDHNNNSATAQIFAGAYVAWDTMSYYTVTSSNQVISTIGFTMGNSDFPPSIAAALNGIKPDSTGEVSLDFNHAGQYAGYFVLLPVGGALYHASPFIMIVAPANFLGDTSLTEEIFCQDQNGDLISMGSVPDSLPFNLKVIQNRDSVTIMLNDVISTTVYSSTGYPVVPALASFVPNSEVDRVTCNFDYPLVSYTNVSNITCPLSTGSVSIVVRGGTQPYHYLWSNGATTSSINNVTAGAYSVTAYSNNGWDSLVTNTQVAYNASWDSLSSFAVDSTNSVVAQNPSNNVFYSSFASALNTLNAGQNGLADFFILPGDSFEGEFGLINNLDFGNDMRYVFFNLDGNSLSYWGDNLGDNNFIGYRNQMAGWHFRIQAAGDSVTFLVYQYNASEANVSITMPYIRGSSFIPIAVGNSNLSRISCVTSFGCVPSPSLSLAVSIIDTPLNNLYGTSTLYSSVVRGTAPYNYLWSRGDTTANLNAARLGNYSVTVTDNVGNTAVNSLFLGQYAIWDSLVNVVDTNGHQIISKGGPVFGSSSATGLNQINADSSGTVYFNFSNVSSYLGAVGLISASDPNYGEELLIIPPDQAQHMLNTPAGIYVIRTNGDDEYLGRLNDGAPLNIGINKTGNLITIIKNGIPLLTDTFLHSSPLHPVVFPIDSGSTITNVVCNFGAPLKIYANSANTNCSVNSGSVTASIKGGLPPYHYRWSRGDTTLNIANLGAGTYFVTAYDYLLDSLVSKFSIGYGETWDSLVNVSVDSFGGLTATNVIGFNIDYAIADNKLSPAQNGWITYTIKAGDNFQGALALTDNLNISSTTGHHFGVFVQGAEWYLSADGLGDYNSWGNYVTGQAYSFTFQTNGDSMIVTKSATDGSPLASLTYYYPRSTTYQPDILEYVTGARVASVRSGFGCYPNLGTLTLAHDTICAGGVDSLSVTAYGGVIAWQKKDISGVWLNVLGLQKNLFTPTVNVNTSYRAILTISGLGNDTSNVVRVITTSSDTSLFNRILISNDLCGPVDTIHLISQVNASFSGGYQWQISADGASFTSIQNANYSDYLLNDSRFQIGWFRRVMMQSQSCSVNSNTIKIGY